MVKDAMMTVLEVFHHRIARNIGGMKFRKGDNGEGEWASVDAALDTTGILFIRECVSSQKANFAEYVAGRPIRKLFTVV